MVKTLSDKIGAMIDRTSPGCHPVKRAMLISMTLDRIFERIRIESRGAFFTYQAD